MPQNGPLRVVGQSSSAIAVVPALFCVATGNYSYDMVGSRLSPELGVPSRPQLGAQAGAVVHQGRRSGMTVFDYPRDEVVTSFSMPEARRGPGELVSASRGQGPFARLTLFRDKPEAVERPDDRD